MCKYHAVVYATELFILKNPMDFDQGNANFWISLQKYVTLALS